VNLASRLEGVNKVYGTHILAARSTVERTADRIRYREIDTVRVKGRLAEGAVFEPLGPKTAAIVADPLVDTYAKALALYRGRHLEEAAALLRSTAAGDPPAASLLARIQELMMAATADWEPVTRLDHK
jgi:hypothetical protein